MSTAYTLRATEQFYKACVHMVHILDQSTREMNAAEGFEGFNAIAGGPFAPDVMWRQFSTRLEQFRTAALAADPTKLSMETRIALNSAYDYATDDAATYMDMAGHDWSEIVAEALSARRAGSIETTTSLDVALAMNSVAEGMAGTRDEIVMHVIPNLQFVLTDLKQQLR